MENNLENARNSVLEWWDIFSATGNTEDARGLMDSIKEYDALLLKDDELEM